MYQVVMKNMILFSLLFDRINFLIRLLFAVRVPRRHSEAHEAVRLVLDGRARPQAAHRYSAHGHQSALVPVLHVQSWTCLVRQREYSP
jgi:hypothetical protein